VSTLYLLLLLLLLLLLVLLLWLLVFDVRKFQGHSVIQESVHGIQSAEGGCHWYNIVLESIAEACHGNIVEDFFMRL
jgi:H+/Cl- antiporter ClcA